MKPLVIPACESLPRRASSRGRNPGDFSFVVLSCVQLTLFLDSGSPPQRGCPE